MRTIQLSAVYTLPLQPAIAAALDMLYLHALHISFTGPAPLSPSQLQTLSDNRYVVIKDWACVQQTASIRQDTMDVSAAGYSFDSRTGNSGRVGSAALDTSVRNSRQCPLYPPPSNAAGSVSTRADLIVAVNALRSQLQASRTLALPHLEPFETELSYLLYPRGGHYKRHLDNSKRREGWKLQGRQAADGGSFCGGRTRRVVSFILYLNAKWKASDGGCLRVFPPHEHIDHDDEASSAGYTEDITPEGGTLVLFMSSDVEHLVRETHAERQCVVGWFREYSEERVPDRDVMSTRAVLPV